MKKISKVWAILPLGWRFVIIGLILGFSIQPLKQIWEVPMWVWYTYLIVGELMFLFAHKTIPFFIETVKEAWNADINKE